MGKRFRCVAIWMVLWAAVFVGWAYGAVETTTVNEKIVLPGGAVATSGSITATLSDEGSTDDSGASQRVAGSVTGTIGSDGTVSLVLVPNDAITPSGTYYDVSISVRAPVRTSWSERWSVTTSPDPIAIGDITRLDAAPGITVGPYLTYASSAPSGSCSTTTSHPQFVTATGDLYVCDSGTWTLRNSATDDDTPDSDAEVPDAITVSGGTITASSITLTQSATPAPTAEGRVEWDTDDDRLVVGNGGGSAAFYSGAHTTAHSDGADCTAGSAPLGVDADGAVEGCFDVATQTELDTHTGSTSNPHSVTASQVGNTTAQWNCSQAHGVTFASGTPSIGDVWTYGGVNWSHTTIGSSAITDNSLTADDLGTGSVDTDELAAGAVTEAKLSSARAAPKGILSGASNVMITNPGGATTNWTNVGAGVRRDIHGDICAVTQVFLAAYGQGTDSCSGKGLRLVKDSDDTELASLTWDGTTADYRNSGWNTLSTSLTATTEVKLQVKHCISGEHITVNSVNFEYRCD